MTRLTGSGVGVVNVLVEDLLSVSVRSEDGRVSVKNVDLLQRQSLGFGNEEVGEEEAGNTARSPTTSESVADPYTARDGAELTK